jgi:hypothetical protein
MIYTEELTSRLKGLLGNDVEEWDKSVIRAELENEVETLHNLAMMAKTKEVRDSAFEVFHVVKDIDNEFTELYIQELNQSL